MSFTDNTTLNAAVAGWLNRSDLTTEIVDFIKLAEHRITNDLMETTILTASSDITTDANNKDLPSNFKGVISAYLDTNPKQTLDYLPPDEFNLRYASSETGKPKAYTLLDNDIYFAPLPDSSYTCKFWYYTTPDIATETTNELLTNFPNLYLWGACVEGFDYLGNEKKVARFEGKYQQALDGALDVARQRGALAIHLSDAP